VEEGEDADKTDMARRPWRSTLCGDIRTSCAGEENSTQNGDSHRLAHKRKAPYGIWRGSVCATQKNDVAENLSAYDEPGSTLGLYSR